MKKISFTLAGLIILLISLDQLSKYLAAKYLTATFQIIPNIFALEYSQNTGIAFGIKINYSFLLILNIILIAAIFYVIIKEFELNKKITQLSLSLVIAGALGNVIDRLTRGFVVDFIAVWKWPNFNFADIYITVGILLMILFYARMTRSERK